MATTDMTVKIQANDKGNPVGKARRRQLPTSPAGPLDGLKLIGFGIWERRGGRPQRDLSGSPVRGDG